MAFKTNKNKLFGFGTILRWLRKSKKYRNRGEQQIDESKSEKKGAAAAAIRVKVMMTRKEAAQFLAMYVRGEEETTAEIISELERAEARWHGAWRPMLASIPED